MEHKTKLHTTSFTAKYEVNKLIYFEGFQDIEQAIRREKYIKGKGRAWKETLINGMILPGLIFRLGYHRFSLSSVSTSSS
ncbi:MAG: GIY-YIG nuclease family protein [Chryseolinea sp.]